MIRKRRRVLMLLLLLLACLSILGVYTLYRDG
jgi:hypothetical protein